MGQKMQEACNKIKEYLFGSSGQKAMSFQKSRIRPMRGMLNVRWSIVKGKNDKKKEELKSKT